MEEEKKTVAEETKETTPAVEETAAAFTQEDIDKNKTMAILAYLIFFLPMICCPDSKFAKYHANQGLLLFILMIIMNVIGTFTCGIGSLVGLIFWIVCFILGLRNASAGEAKPLPLIGKFTILK